MLREDWLEKMIDLLRPDFVAVGKPLPEKIRVSCGFPSKNGLAKKAPRIGECWGVESSEDKSFQVFISPVLKEGVEVTATLVHELVHAAVGIECKHRGEFPKTAKAVGLEGKMTETTAGAALIIRLKAMIEQLGEYPHARLIASNKPKTQSTRMLKVVCQGCECVVRMTRKWLDDVGAPTCACGSPMIEEGCEPEESMSDPDDLQMLQPGLQDIEAGRLHSHEDVSEEVSDDAA